MNPKRPATAAIYTRISRDVEGNKVGVQRQEKDCRALAKTLGLSVAKVYTDNDVGASNRTGAKPRPAYAQMLEDAQAGLISTIIAYSNSRLTRRPLEWVELIALAETGKLQIKTVVSGSHDLTTADGRAVALTVAAWDSAEAERISERQKAAFHHRALQGKPKLQRQRPFGWEQDGITIREEEARHIRAAVEELIQGATIAHISHKWENLGLITAAGNTRWDQAVVRNILTGWRIAGVRTYRRQPLHDEHGDLVMGTWEPIITVEQRSQVLLALKQHARTKKRQGKWLLSGMLRCGICAKPMYGLLPSGRRGRATYACKNGHLAISAGLLEQHVIAEVMTHIHKLTRRTRENREEALTIEAEPDPADVERVDELSLKITELMDAYRVGSLPGAIVFSEVDKLHAERTELQAVIDTSKVKLTRTLPPLAEHRSLEEGIELYQNTLKRRRPEPHPALNDLDLMEQQPEVSVETIEETNALFRLAVESIVIQPNQKGIKPTDRVSIHYYDQ